MTSHHADMTGDAVALAPRFALRAPCGAEVTPHRPKERALLAALAHAPGRRLRRVDLQRALWADRAAEPARASLRRVLCDLRATLGHRADLVASDRYEVWLRPGARVDCPELAVPNEPAPAPSAPALAGWLAATGRGDRTRPALGRGRPMLDWGDGAVPDGGGMLVAITPDAGDADGERVFLVSLLCDALASRIAAEGPADVTVGPPPPPARIAAAAVFLHLEVAAGGALEAPQIQLRALAGPERQFLWSGRLRVGDDADRMLDGAMLAGFVSTAWTAILERHRARRAADRAPYLLLNRAAAALFTGERRDHAWAEESLRALATGDATPVALAWSAFARLTRAIEFADPDPLLAEGAAALAADAVARAPTNPLVLALAATVALRLSGDVERSRFLARAAERACDSNPYALVATAEVDAEAGAVGAAHDRALHVRLAAEGLANTCYWEMQVTATAVRCDDAPAARATARAAHAANPDYRPALRYLTMLDLLEHPEEPSIYLDRLRALEPGFEPSRFRDPGYPVRALQSSPMLERLAV